MCWFQHRRSLENAGFHKNFAVTDDHVFARVRCSRWLIHHRWLVHGFDMSAGSVLELESNG